MPNLVIVRIMLETSKFLKGLQILSKIFVKTDTIKKCKVFRQEFYADSLTSVISLRNLPILKVVKFPDDFPTFC